MNLITSLSLFDWLTDHTTRNFDDLNKSIDVKIKDDDISYQIDFIVPGVKKNHLSVLVDGKILSVDVNSPEGTIIKSKRIVLPNVVPNITSKLEDGILTVTIPKEQIKKDKYKVDIE